MEDRIRKKRGEKSKSYSTVCRVVYIGMVHEYHMISESIADVSNTTRVTSLHIMDLTWRASPMPVSRPINHTQDRLAVYQDEFQTRSPRQ